MTVGGLSNNTVIPQANTTVAAVWGHTQINVVKLSYVWTIINYSFLPDRNILSPVFSAGEGETKWQLELYPKSYSSEYDQYVSLFLHLISSNQREITAKVNFNIVNAKNEKSTKFTERSYSFPSGRFEVGYVNFMRRDLLQSSGNEFLLDDKLRILCEISASSDVLVTSGPKDSINFNATERHLPNDLGYLFQSQRFSDVTLVAGEFEYKAHKPIVASRSSVLSGFFEDDLEKNRFVLIAMARNVFREMMRFIYTDTVENLDDLAGDLLMVAKEYDLEKLQLMCENALLKKLTIDNAVDLLIIADASNSSQMKKKFLDYIVRHAGAVMRTKSFANITNSHPNLSAEILSRVLTLVSVDRETSNLHQG